MHGERSANTVLSKVIGVHMYVFIVGGFRYSVLSVHSSVNERGHTYIDKSSEKQLGLSVLLSATRDAR